jgi:hypothetical protein
VTVLATSNTGLAADDVFHFGNLVGEADGDGQVGDSDYEALVGEFGRSGSDLITDFNGSGRVDLADFAIFRSSFGDSLVDPPVLMGDLDGSGEVDDGDYDILIAQFGLTGDGLSADLNNDQQVDATDFAILRNNFGNTLSPAPGAPAVDLLAELPSAAGYLSEPQSISGNSPTTGLQFAATSEYDLRPLTDDPAAGGEDDLLVDVLAESPLAVLL